MNENQQVKKRLILFIQHLGVSQGKFEREVGLANGYVNNIRVSITPEKLKMIALRYPELNKGWLMTGEGEMLTSSKTTTQIAGEHSRQQIQGDGSGNSQYMDSDPENMKEALAIIKSQHATIEKTTAELLSIVNKLLSQKP